MKREDVKREDVKREDVKRGGHGPLRHADFTHHVLTQYEPSMPYSSVVEQRYRLQPSDLRGPMQVTITNVSLQGLEKMRPVLHFDKFGKRLALDDVQSDELARITRSAVFADWVGHAVMLEPIDEEGAVRIALSSPPFQPTPQFTSQLTRSHQRRTRRTQFGRKSMGREQARILLQSLLLLLLILLIAAAVYLLNNTEIIWRWLDGFNSSSG